MREADRSAESKDPLPARTFFGQLGVPRFARDDNFIRAHLRGMPYTVPKLTEFSAAALDNATEELKIALKAERLTVFQDALALRKRSGLGHTADWEPFRNRWINSPLAN